MACTIRVEFLGVDLGEFDDVKMGPNYAITDPNPTRPRPSLVPGWTVNLARTTDEPHPVRPPIDRGRLILVVDGRVTTFDDAVLVRSILDRRVDVDMLVIELGIPTRPAIVGKSCTEQAEFACGPIIRSRLP